MTVHNRTVFTEAEIATFPILGETISNWRQRTVTLYKHPMPGMVISVGITFDEKMTVISEDTVEDWTVALDYASRGKVLVTH